MNILNFADLSLPDPNTVTPEQFQQAEPLLLRYIIESVYTNGIQPLRQGQYRLVAPGEYEGEFNDKAMPALRFKFKSTPNDITYSPINPEVVEKPAANASRN